MERGMEWVWRDKTLPGRRCDIGRNVFENADTGVRRAVVGGAYSQPALLPCQPVGFDAVADAELADGF
jgi:hypothetical protein